MTASLADARRLLAVTRGCGAIPPPALEDLIAAHDAIAGSSAPLGAVDDLVSAVVTGKLRGAQLEERIAAAAAAHQTAEFRRGLAQPAQTAVMKEFVAELRSGAANTVIASVRPAFDAAAHALVDCAKHVDPHVDPVAYLEHASDEQRYASQAIKPNIEVLTKIAAVVCQFGPKSGTFPLVELPVQVGGTAALSDVALMCINPKYNIEQASAAFNGTGTHRQSPWFLAANMLQLNDIETVAETVRAWAERAWESLGLNVGRGRMEGKTFVPTPIRNPYARKELAK